MKKISLFIWVILFLVSCAKDENSNKKICDFTDPIEQLSWLKEIKNSMTNCSCEMSIMQATYENQTIFYAAMTDLLCDGYQTITIYDCDGKVIRAFKNSELQGFYEKQTNKKVLYRCKTTP